MKNPEKNEDKKNRIIIPEGVTYHPEDYIDIDFEVDVRGTWDIGGRPENIPEFFEVINNKFALGRSENCPPCPPAGGQ